MMEPIIHTADFHLDCRNPDVSSEGKYIREAEALSMTDALHALAVDTGAAAIIIAGDIANYRNPRAWAYVVFRRFLEKCEADGIKVVGLRGNHDGDDLSRREFAEAFPSSLITYARKPTVLKVAGRDVLLLPWAGRSTVAAKAGHTMTVAEQHGYMQQAFERIIQTHPADIIVTHFTIAGAKYSSEAQPMLGDSGELMLPVGMFNQPHLRHVVSGHIHKAQVLTNGAVPIMYPGSTILCDFGQESETPHVVIDHGKHTELVPLEYDHLRFVTVNNDDPVDPDMLRGAIVRYKGAVPSGDEGARIVSERMSEIAACEPAYIAKPVLTLERHEARFSHSIRAETLPSHALEEYARLVGGEYQERIDALMTIHEDIQKEVNDEADHA